MLASLPDYTQPCTQQGLKTVICPDAGIYCTSSTQCRAQTCTNSCPPPLPNSHYVSDNCTGVIVTTCRKCDLIGNFCAGTGRCSFAGDCSYDCDAGYVWNGSACVLAPAASAGIGGGSNLMAAIVSFLRRVKKQRRKRKAYIATMT